MGCLLTTGFTSQVCGDAAWGGIAPKFYLLNKDNFVTKYDGTGNPTGFTVTGSDKAFLFEAVNETASFEEKFTLTDYGNMIVQTLGYVVINLTPAQKAIVEKKRFARLMAIIKYDESPDLYELIGDSGTGLKMTAGDAASGKKHTDAKGLSLAFEGSNKTYAKSIPFAAFSSLIA